MEAIILILARPEVASAIAAVTVAIAAAVVRKLENKKIAQRARRDERKRIADLHEIPELDEDTQTNVPSYKRTNGKR